MPFSRKLLGRGLFSLLELAVVFVILGVVAVIVGPRMSRGASVSPRQNDQILVGHLRLLREALDAYAADHAGHYPNGDPARIAEQLTQYTDRAGEPAPTRSASHPFGPYLREIPALPVGGRSRTATIALVETAPAAWLYNPATGRIRANTTADEFDPLGRPYSSY
jgi:type II secretory pathway pseudopilin PulG